MWDKIRKKVEETEEKPKSKPYTSESHEIPSVRIFFLYEAIRDEEKSWKDKKSKLKIERINNLDSTYYDSYDKSYS